MNKIEIFKQLFGQTITKLERIIVLTGDSDSTEIGSVVLSDTLLFILSNGNCFQVLVTSEDLLFKEIVSKQDFILSFSLEDDETVNSVPIYENIEIPFTIASVIETWAGKDDPFLVAVNFLDKNKQSLLSILTETDEIIIVSSEELRTIINQMIFDYELILYRWYGC